MDEPWLDGKTLYLPSEKPGDSSMLKFLGIAVLIIFLIGLAVVFGFFKLIF